MSETSIVDSTTPAGTAPAAATSGQVSHDAAALYERFFVPALFAQWTDPVLDAAAVGSATQRVLDIACGSGVLARAAAARIGEPVSGRRHRPERRHARPLRAERAPGIDWRVGRAERIGFDDATSKPSCASSGLMVLREPEAGLREMLACLRPRRPARPSPSGFDGAFAGFAAGSPRCSSESSVARGR